MRLYCANVKDVNFNKFFTHFTSFCAIMFALLIYSNVFMFMLLLLLAALPTLLHASTLGVHFVRSPESAVAPNGDEVLFECEVNLEPEQLEWIYRRTKSAGGSNRFKKLPLNIAEYNVTNDLLVSKLRVVVSTETLAEYRCVGWFGPLAVTSTTASLTLAHITVDKDENRTLVDGTRWSVTAKNSVLIRCDHVKSQPAAVWSFYRNGVKLQQDDFSASSGVLVLNSLSAKDSGNYTCTATNTVSAEVVWLPNYIELYVESDNNTRKAPYFLSDNVPTSIAAREGDTIVLECPGVGTPEPKPVWSSPDLTNIHNNRTKVLAYGFKINELRVQDEGTYICRLDNGVAPPLVHTIVLSVQHVPKIVEGPEAKLTNEGEALDLHCNATGKPKPQLYWLMNGEGIQSDNQLSIYRDGLLLRRVQKRHAGVVQCFAKNELGEVSAGTVLKVNPKQIQSDAEELGTRRPNRRKHGKNLHMVPPSAPNVTRLSDESVMLRWQVEKNDGLAIQFFKVQYRMFGDGTRKLPRENWQTTNEDIPYGKRNRNNPVQGKSFTSSVTGLKPDRYYRFRIIAVYTNNDNKESNTSAKFYLQRGSTLGIARASLPVPELVDIEAYSETAVILHWTLPANHNENLLEGFYAYYRPSTSAGEYFKATIDGAQARKLKIGTLEPSTVYEFKLQSFNSLSASKFSDLKQGRTLRPSITPIITQPPIISTTPVSTERYTMYPLLAGAVSGGTLLLLTTVCLCLCLRRRKNTQPENENKPQLEQQLQEEFVALGAYAQQKSHNRPHVHITLNPLAQHEDKTTTQQSHHHHHHHHMSVNQEQVYFQRQTNNARCDGSDVNFNGRISSLRRTQQQRTLERVGGNNNNRAYDGLAVTVGSGTSTAGGGSPQTPKSMRVLHKRPRLSSRSETLSSAGSVNSVGV